MDMDDIEVTVNAPPLDLRFGYPLDCTGSTFNLFNFSFNKPEDEFLNPTPKESITWRVSLKENISRWCHDTLNYSPQFKLLKSLDDSMMAHLLMFASREDAMLFRINFGHLFK